MQLGNGAVQFPEDALSTWDDTTFSFEYWCGDWGDPETYAIHPRLFDVADFSDFNNLNLKFGDVHSLRQIYGLACLDADLLRKCVKAF